VKGITEWMLNEWYFQNPRIIFNVRNISSILSSRRRIGWFVGAHDEVLLHQIFQYFKDFGDAHRVRTIVVDYDEYANDPSSLAPLFAFLGEPFRPDLVADATGQRYVP